MIAATSSLREPWERLDEQNDAARFGIWIFLASEVLFFGAFFLAFAYLRILHPASFMLASSKTELVYGTTNTALLLTSGLTMGLALKAAEFRLEGYARAFLATTACLGLSFLIVKGFEYRDDIAKGLVPGVHFALASSATQLFFGAYWIVTVVHLIHLTIGIGLVGRLALVAGRTTPLASPQIEVTALYWAFVDIVWILLYPLVYLEGLS